MNLRRIPSIRWKVQLWHGTILLVVISAFCVAAMKLNWTQRLRVLDAEMRNQSRDVVFQLAAMPEETQPDPGKGEGPGRFWVLFKHIREGTLEIPAALREKFESKAPGHVALLFHDNEGRILFRTAQAPQDFPLLRGKPGGPPTDDVRTIGDYRLVLATLPEGLGFVFARELGPEREEARRFNLTLIGLGLGLWIVGLAGGWWLGGRALRPIEVISGTAVRISDGALEERIDTTGMSRELRSLSNVLNETFDRLRASIEQQKQFTGDASHELRTPLTIVLSETHRLLKKERTADEYRAGLELMEASAKRMKRLVEDLLLLARQDGASGPVHEPMDFGHLAVETAKSLEPLAAERGLRLAVQAHPASCVADPVALGIVLTNLLANAIQHHDQPSGRISVTTGTDEEGVFCTVEDDGPGVAMEHLPHIFDRFYRVDRARSSSGHSGLGLAIANTIVKRHKGLLTATPLTPRGLRVTVFIPNPTTV